MRRHSGLYGRRLRTLRERVGRLVRALFGGGNCGELWDDGLDGGVGVREPRRPLAPTLTGFTALELPPDD